MDDTPPPNRQPGFSPTTVAGGRFRLFTVCLLLYAAQPSQAAALDIPLVLVGVLLGVNREKPSFRLGRPIPPTLASRLAPEQVEESETAHRRSGLAMGRADCVDAGL